MHLIHMSSILLLLCMFFYTVYMYMLDDTVFYNQKIFILGFFRELFTMCYACTCNWLYFF